MSGEQTFSDKCKAFLQQRWGEITHSLESGKDVDVLGDEYANIKDLVRDCLTSRVKSYHYVLPTQVLCKVVDPSINVHSLQVAWGVPGAFDARTIAHSVIVPFDQDNSRVLGGSPEPYVNNPLRCPAVSRDYREQQKNKEDWDNLVAVLDVVEEKTDQVFTALLFDQILIEIYRRLADVCVTYPVPNRISLGKTYDLINTYLSAKSGGDRAEAVCTALFRTIGETFAIFDDVRREKVNVADSSSGMPADIECWLQGKIVLLVEVKDRTLTLTQLDDKLDTARANRISEILFLAQRGMETVNREAIDQRIEAEFVSGQNIYVSDFGDFSLGILILFGEKGRVEFLTEIGNELDRSGSAILHRKTWAQLLRNA